MAFAMTPGPEGGGRTRHLHLQPWPRNPGSHGELPGPLDVHAAARRIARGVVRPRPAAPPALTPEGRSRPLREGEKMMAFKIFGRSLDYSQVRVHNEEFLPFGLQPNNTAMTPNGELYFNPTRFKEDFSAGPNHEKHWFMHEMVHVWQYQLGYPVMWRGAIRIGLPYEYTLDAAKKLGDYNMEAQGDLLADYFGLKFLRDATTMAQPQYRNSLPLYEQVLSLFLADPSDTDNLP
jgi:hypothetical protein